MTIYMSFQNCRAKLSSKVAPLQIMADYYIRTPDREESRGPFEASQLLTLAEAGQINCAFVTGRGKRAIADHFDISYELEHQISGTSKEQYLEGIRDVIDRGIFTMVRQREMKGLGHAILTGEPLIGDQAFGVLLADDMCINQQGAGVLAQMSELYNQFRCSIVAVMEVPNDQISAYGVISGEAMGDSLYRVDKMVEKPAPEDAPSNLAVIGRYILTPDIFDIIRETPPGRNGEVQITDALQIQANRGCVLAYKFQGQRFDCGSVPGFVEATNFVFENLY